MHKIDGTTWAALLCVAIGWFWMNTLVATFGPIQHLAHFYDLAAILKDPTQLLTGVGDLARWANGASVWTGDVIARHISVGAGGYLSFIASGLLAAKGSIEPRGTARPI
jgi:hypothetical protein